MTLIVYGLFKKMVIADNVALHVNSIFSEGAALDNTALVWWGALCSGSRYTAISQIYRHSPWFCPPPGCGAA